METFRYFLQAALRGALIVGLSLSVFAQIPGAPDASGLVSGRKALDFRLASSAACSDSAPSFRVSRDSDRRSNEGGRTKVPCLESIHAFFKARLVRFRWH